MDAEELRIFDARADGLIRNWSVIALLANLPPPPFDMMAVGTTFALMGSRLARIYGIETNPAMLKEMGSSLAGGVGAVLAGYYVATGLLKYVPGVNLGVVLLIQPPVVGAVAFSVGHAFKQYYHAILLEDHEMSPTDFTEIATASLHKRLDLVGNLKRTRAKGYEAAVPSPAEIIQNGTYEDRKVLILVRNEKEGQEIMKKVVKNRLPFVPVCLMEDRIGIVTLQGGLPQSHVVYFGHPYKRSLYYPAANFHFQVMHDKAFELVHILRSLGAIHYRIEHVRGFDAKSVLGGDLGVPTKLTKAEIKGKAGFRRKQEQAFRWEEHLEPSGEPQLPPDLIWYNSEPVWQELAESRLKHKQAKVGWRLYYSNDFGINGRIESALKLIKPKLFQLSFGGEISEFQATEWNVDVTWE